MRLLLLGVVFSVACSACKPAVRQEPASKEQSVFLLRNMREAFRNALQSGNFSGALKVLRRHKPSQLHYDLVFEQVRAMHYSELVGFVSSYSVHIPVAEISQQLKQIDSSVYSAELSIHLQQLRDMLMTVRDDFDRFDLVVDAAKAGISERVYMEQTELMRTGFKSWAEPLRGQVREGLENFYRRDSLHSTVPTLEQAMDADVYAVWQEIETILVKTNFAGD